MAKSPEPVMTSILTAKVVVLGDPAVGKTSLRHNFMGLTFEKSYGTTIGVDFANKHVILSEGDKEREIDLQIWDLAGQKAFLKLTNIFLQNVHGCLLVFDLTNPDTIQCLKWWLNELYLANRNRAERIPFITLGNKVDLINPDDHAVNDIGNHVDYLANYEQFSLERNKYLPTSAKDGTNVDIAFKTLAQMILKL